MFFSEITVPSTYHLIDSPKKLAWLFQELSNAPEEAVDVETNHPTWKGKKKLPAGFVEVLSGISFAWGRTEVTSPWRAGNAAYIPLRKSDDTPYWGVRQGQVEGALKEHLESPIPKVMQNGKFDVRKLATLLEIYTEGLAFDTMLAHALLDEERLVCSHALKSDLGLAGQIIKLGMSDAYLDTQASLFKGDLAQALQFYDPHLKRYSKVPLKVLYPYGCADADLTLSLKFVFEPMLEAENLIQIYYGLIIPLQHTLMLMELHGVPLDIAQARHILQEQAAILHETETAVQQMVGSKFNVGSPTQLGKILFETLQLPGTRGKDGRWITEAEELKKLDHEVIAPLLAFRRAEQIHGHYAEPALDKVVEVTNEGRIGWVHPTVWMDSVTGRLKYTDPNLTTLPRPENGGMIVKSMWCAADDYRMIFKDFSQIELRVTAHLSREPVWVDGFNAGDDMHAATAAKMWHPGLTSEEVKEQFPADRSRAKTVNFGVLYGQTAYSLAARLGMTPEEAQHFIEVDYFGTVPVLRSWIEATQEFAKTAGYVNNIFGRRRHLPNAGLIVPESVPAPRWDVRPACYKDGPYAKALGLDPADLYGISEADFYGHLSAKSGGGFEQCAGCPYLKSCVINREVRFVQGKVNHAFRQAVNSPIQGSAVDMASLALVWINEELQRHKLPASPILHIHDELVVHSHVSCIDQVCAIMDDCMMRRLKEFTHFSVPLLVDTEIVQRWSDKHLKEEE